MRIVVEADKETVAWEDGKFYVPKHLEKTLKQNILIGMPVKFVEESTDYYQPGTQTLEEILAALYSLAPGRSYLIEGPEELEELFTN